MGSWGNRNLPRSSQEMNKFAKQQEKSKLPFICKETETAMPSSNQRWLRNIVWKMQIRKDVQADKDSMRTVEDSRVKKSKIGKHRIADLANFGGAYRARI